MGDVTQGNFEVVGGSPAVRDALAAIWCEYAGPPSWMDPDPALHPGGSRR